MEGLRVNERYEFVCRDKDGKEKWRETIIRRREPPEPPAPSLGAGGLALVLILGLLLTPLAWLVPVGLLAFSMLGLVTNEGLNHILDTQFTNSSQVATWYLGLIAVQHLWPPVQAGIAGTDVMNSHTGWTEFTNYDEATREEFDEAASSGQVVTTSVVATFTFAGAGTITGAFLTSNNTKGGTTGVLFSAAQFDEGNRAVIAADTLDVTFSVGASDN